jgi:hypothetical protein
MLVSQMEEHMVSQPLSGLKIKHYCTLHNIKPGTFYYWKNKLSKDVGSAVKGFSELTIPERSMHSMVSIHYPDGVQCHFNIVPDALLLKKLLYATP